MAILHNSDFLPGSIQLFRSFHVRARFALYPRKNHGRDCTTLASFRSYPAVLVTADVQQPCHNIYNLYNMYIFFGMRCIAALP